MSIWDGLEVAAETLRKADKIPEYKEILAAMGTVRGLENSLHKAEQTIRDLEAELKKRSAIDGPIPPFGYFYEKEQRENPFCPRCYQSKESTLSFMTPPKNWSGGIRRDCRLCGLTVWEKETSHARGEFLPSSPFS